VVHPDLVWQDDLPDAPTHHGDLREAIIDEALGLESTRPALGRIFLGPAGSGKTHLLAGLRRRAMERGITFVMADLTDVKDFFDTLLLGFLVSLQQPGPDGQPQFRAILASVVDSLGAKEKGAHYVSRMAACKPAGLAALINGILQHLQRKYPAKTPLHRDVVRAMVLLNANDYESQSIGQTWLQGLEIDTAPQRLYGFAAPGKKPSDIVRGLSWLSSLRGPSIVAIDQLDPIVAHYQLAAQAQALQPQDESILLAKAILNDLCNGLGNLHTATSRTLPVVTCLETSFDTLKHYGLSANIDRYHEPQSLPPMTGAAVAEAVVRSRLDPAYEAAGFAAPYATWPFAPGFFAEAGGHFPRALLKRCEEHRKHCVRHGAITELHSLELDAVPPPAVRSGEGQAPLDQRFASLCAQANVGVLLDEKNEDELLSGLLVTAATCLVKEWPGSDTIDAVVDSDFPGRGRFMPLHARIRVIAQDNGTEKHYCLRALEKSHAAAYQARLRAAMTSAGIDRKLDFRRLVLFRAGALPGGRVTEQRTKDFFDRGGLLVKPRGEEIAALWALQQMAAEGHEAFDQWLQERRPVSGLRMMQEARLVKTPAAPQTGPGHEQDHGNGNGNKKEAGAPSAPLPVHSAPSETGALTPVAGEVRVGTRLIGGEARGSVVTLPLAELRKHVAIFAGSGSGKTVLVKRIIEEAALLGVPAIVVDTANDLAQLGEPWPQPQEAWEPKGATRADRYFQTTETIVWTPGLERGNPLRLEPLPDLAAVANDVDELNDAVAMARETLEGVVAPGRGEAARNRLGILTAALKFFAREGGGGLAAFVELLSDLPDDAGGGVSDAARHAAKMADALRSQMQLDPLLGPGGEALDPAVLLGLGQPGGRTRISVLNFAGLPTLDQQQQFLNRLAMTLFSWIKRNPARGEAALRGLLVLDEARDFVPSAAGTACRASFMRLTAQARKYGLGLVFATQAPKDIFNGIVSNCATSFYGTASSPAVINAIKELLQDKGGRGDDIARLGTGRFYVHNADVTQTPIKVATPLCLSHHRAPLTPDEITACAQASRARLGTAE
jgi:hypothetical protein